MVAFAAKSEGVLKHRGIRCARGGWAVADGRRKRPGQRHRGSVVRQDHGGQGTVGLGDDPKAVAAEAIGGEQSAAILEGQVVGDRILGKQITPVAPGVTAEFGQYLLGSQA
jgi:hypothetical protein